MWAYGASADGGPGPAEIKTTADKVGTAFISPGGTAQATPENMGDVIVSDYAKLKEVGTYGGCKHRRDRVPNRPGLQLRRPQAERPPTSTAASSCRRG